MKTLFIEPGSPWENGYIESFNGKPRDELLNREVFTTLIEAQVLIDNWRQEYNTVRCHSVLRYRPTAPEAVLAALNLESGALTGVNLCTTARWEGYAILVPTTNGPTLTSPGESCASWVREKIC